MTSFLSKMDCLIGPLGGTIEILTKALDIWKRSYIKNIYKIFIQRYLEHCNILQKDNANLYSVPYLQITCKLSFGKSFVVSKSSKATQAPLYVYFKDQISPFF